MTKRQDLYLQRRSRSEQSDQRQPNQAANISHQPRASPDSTLLASRIEFPTMTAVGLVGCSDFDVETCCDSQINSVLSADVSFQLAGYCLRCCSQPSAAKAPARTVAPTTKAIPRNARLCRMACLIVPPHPSLFVPTPSDVDGRQSDWFLRNCATNQLATKSLNS